MRDQDLDRLKKEIDDIIDVRKGSYISFLTQLLRFKTVSSPRSDREKADSRKAFSDAFRFIRDEAERLGLKYNEHEGMALVLDWVLEDVSENGSETVGIACHLDVVPGGKGWAHPPFGGTVADNQIWGRGAQDDKGPIAMTFAVLDVLKRLDYKPEKNIRIILGTREETDEWEDIDLLLKRDQIPDMVMVPDGIFPIINGEKGMVMIRWKAIWDEMADEEGDLELFRLKGGKRHNMVPERAEVLIRCDLDLEEAVADRLAKTEIAMNDFLKEFNMKTERTVAGGGNDGRKPNNVFFKITFRGKTAHGAFPEKGHNALLDALTFVDILDPGPKGMRSFISALRERCSRLDGSGFEVSLHDDYMGDTTVNLGIAEINPIKGNAMINVRFPRGLTCEDVEERFRHAARNDSNSSGNKKRGGLHITSSITGRSQEPLFIDPDDNEDFLDPMRRAYRSSTGRKKDLDSISGTTYAKAFEKAAAFGPVDEPGGEEELAHEPNERISIDGFLKKIRTYALALILLTENENLN